MRTLTRQGQLLALCAAHPAGAAPSPCAIERAYPSDRAHPGARLLDSACQAHAAGWHPLELAGLIAGWDDTHKSVTYVAGRADVPMDDAQAALYNAGYALGAQAARCCVGGATRKAEGEIARLREAVLV